MDLAEQLIALEHEGCGRWWLATVAPTIEGTGLRMP
jgi:hypothetical protein